MLQSGNVILIFHTERRRAVLSKIWIKYAIQNNTYTIPNTISRPQNLALYKKWKKSSTMIILVSIITPNYHFKVWEQSAFPPILVGWWWTGNDPNDDFYDEYDDAQVLLFGHFYDCDPSPH